MRNNIPVPVLWAYRCIHINVGDGVDLNAGEPAC